MSKITLKNLNDKLTEDLVKSVEEDYLKRREERKNLERQWKLNLNYLSGNQYCEISPTGEIKEEEKYYGWQQRSVFNHIAPILDIRLAKLSRINPVMSVRASSSEDKDIKTAMVSSEILNSTYNRLKISKVVSKATNWSESCGTAFYKITWNDKGGKKIGSKDGKDVFEGDVLVSAIPPFEIFPDCLHNQEIEDCNSIIHARAVDVDEIKELYGVSIEGEEIDVFSLDNGNFSYYGSEGNKKITSSLKNHTLVIEKYVKPSSLYKNGRLIIVAGGKLLFDGDLPYENGVDGNREFPFIKQTCITETGSFFGVSLIERLIPIQRAYNAVKNRKYEFMNRISMGVINVEDGSIDCDDLADEGLTPGKVIVYRQGSRPPQMMQSNNVPIDFNYEEDKLLSEFIALSGTSEISRGIDTSSHTLSGTAIELLIEQDETRISVCSENIRNAVKESGRQILRLYKQFAKDTRIMKSSGDGKKVKLFYFNSSDLTSDDVIFDTENGLTQTPAQKKTAVLELLRSGLLTDSNGVLDVRTKAKILEILGYGSLDNVQDIAKLHKDKAEKENIELENKEIEVDEYDEHSIHIEEHIRKLLESDVNLNISKEYKNNLSNHLKQHRKLVLVNDVEKVIKEIESGK